MEEASSSSSSSSQVYLGASPAIDRHNPIIRDSRRSHPISNPTTKAPPTSPLFDSPSPPEAHKKTSIKSEHCGLEATSQENCGQKRLSNQKTKRKNTTKPFDIIRRNSSCVSKPDKIQFTPYGSSRYLLGSDGFNDLLPDDADCISELAPVENKENLSLALSDDLQTSFSSTSASFLRIFDKFYSSSHRNTENSSSPTEINLDQVVVLWVSLHCKGCARKVKKHISRMKGVTSFKIEFAAKKVTVIGDVTPLEVLSSISKVKNAQLWTPDMSKPSLQTSANDVVRELKKDAAGGR